MFRRKFITNLALAATAVSAAAASENRTIIYRVKGFTCITCAVGLDTVLGQKAGVVRSQSSYPDGKTTIEFKPSIVNEAALKAFIAEMGFSAAEIPHAEK